MTGSSGVLGRATVPRLREADLELDLPSRSELDLFDPAQVQAALDRVAAVLHLATRIPAPEHRDIRAAWQANDRLRDDATALLVQAALGCETAAIVVPTVAFIYPPGPADESTPLAGVPPTLLSALSAEAHLDAFTACGRRGVALRLGLLYGPMAATKTPSDRYPVHLHTDDAALTAALDAPGGLYNVVDDDDPVSHERFTRATGWRPRHGHQAAAAG